MLYQGIGSLLTCPNLHCPKRDHSDQVIRFGFYRLKRGRRRRYRSRACGKTYSRTTHTLYHRLRSSTPRIERVAAMSVEGMSRAAIARVEHIDPHTVEVWSRLWVSTVVGARTAENTQRLLHDTVTRRDFIEDCLVTTDGYQPYTRVIRDLLGDTCVYAQVVKTLRHNRVIQVVQKLIIGTPERLEQALV